MDRNDVSRRTFVAGAAGVAAAVPALAQAAPAAVAQAAPALTPDQVLDVRRLQAPVPFHFDMKAFNAALNQPFSHRQVLAPTSFRSAVAALGEAQRSIDSYRDPLGFNAGPNALHIAFVYYGGDSLTNVFDDTIYAKYPIFEMIEAGMNPGDAGLAARAKTIKANANAADVQKLVTDHGASFFVCNNALSGFSYSLAKKVAAGDTPLTRAQIVSVHDELAAHLLAGSMVVPTGVGALNAIQEAHFTFLPALG